MKLYLVTRYGTATDPDGPDGPDTNFLIRADGLEEAAHIADTSLQNIPVHWTPAGRPVQDFCHQICELGDDARCDPQAAIVHGPWILHAIIQSPGYQTWCRDSPAVAWELFASNQAAYTQHGSSHDVIGS